jgi:hypothetical protein
MRFISSSDGICFGCCGAGAGAALAAAAGWASGRARTGADPRARYPTNTPITRQTAAMAYICQGCHPALPFANSCVSFVIAEECSYQKIETHASYQTIRRLST